MPPLQVLLCAEPSPAERVAEVLRARGYAVETAGDGERALELAERTHPSVLLAWSDVAGPGAPDLIRRVRSGSSTMLVAAVVPSTDAEQATALLQAGADALLLDRANPEFIAWTVDRIMEGGLVLDPALARMVVPPLAAAVALRSEPARRDTVPVSDRSPLESSAESDELMEYEPGVDFQKTDVAEIVHEGAAESARAHPSVLVQVNAPPRLPAVAETAALRAVVRLLVDNACRDSEAGSDVTVKARQTDAGITVLVTDRGPGLDREQAAAAFGAKGDPADGAPAVGLNLARALVAVHGGILFAEPLPSGGNRVSFTIPERPPVLSGVELQGAIRALELLERFETSLEPAPSPGEEFDAEGADRDGQLLEAALDLSAAAADGATVAEAPFPQQEEASRARDPVAFLADLFDLEPTAAELADVGPLQETDHEAEVDVETVVEPDAEPSRAEPVSVPDAGSTQAEPMALPDAEPALEPSTSDEVPEEQAPEDDHVSVPEPVPAANAASNGSERPAHPRKVPPKTFVPDPLHPATAILRSLAEDYDSEPNPFLGR